MTWKNLQCPDCGSPMPAWKLGMRAQSCPLCGREVLAERSAAAEVARLGPRLPRLRPERAPGALHPGVVVATLALAVVCGAALTTYLVRRSAREPAPRKPDINRIVNGSTDARGPQVLAGLGGSKALDLDKLVAHATRIGRRVFPDAELYRIYSEGVRADGTVRLRSSRNTMVQLRSPARSRATGDSRLECWYTLEAQVDRVSSYPVRVGPGSCRSPVVLPPSCTAREIWRRASADGLPADTLASLDYTSKHAVAFARGTMPAGVDPDQHSEGLWRVSADQPRFVRSYPDDCPRPPPTGLGQPEEARR